MFAALAIAAVTGKSLRAACHAAMGAVGVAMVAIAQQTTWRALSYKAVWEVQ